MKVIGISADIEKKIGCRNIPKIILRIFLTWVLIIKYIITNLGWRTEACIIICCSLSLVDLNFVCVSSWVAQLEHLDAVFRSHLRIILSGKINVLQLARHAPGFINLYKGTSINPLLAGTRSSRGILIIFELWDNNRSYIIEIL